MRQGGDSVDAAVLYEATIIDRDSGREVAFFVLPESSVPSEPFFPSDVASAIKELELDDSDLRLQPADLLTAIAALLDDPHTTVEALQSQVSRSTFENILAEPIQF